MRMLKVILMKRSWIIITITAMIIILLITKIRSGDAKNRGNAKFSRARVGVHFVYQEQKFKLT